MKYLSVEEAAKEKGVSEHAITYLCRKKKLNGEKKKGFWLIYNDEAFKQYQPKKKK